jgi:hypothetical protein
VGGKWQKEKVENIISSTFFSTLNFLNSVGVLTSTPTVSVIY